MAAGKLNLQAADGAVIGLVVPDGLTSGERQISLGVNLSGIAAYHLLQGNLAVSASTITQGFNTTLYTGNGTTQDVNTGIDMDTQWGNDASEKFGGLVWLKSRTTLDTHNLTDTVRGVNNDIRTNSTAANEVAFNFVTGFSSTGIAISNSTAVNQNAATYASWNFQTTHRVSGVTNHGKAYTCHYNPFTGFTIVKYEGSGIAGHEIPHMLGRKLGFVTFKSLSSVGNWLSVSDISNTYQYLNLTNAGVSSIGILHTTESMVLFDVQSIDNNTSTNQYIMYGWANSYLDEADKLIGNYELVTYQGTGAAGNKVKTKGKPAWVMIKRIDAVDQWVIMSSNTNSFDSYLFANATTVEQTYDHIDVNVDGFTFKQAGQNASGGTYIALVAYDTNANGGGSYYPLASDTANVQINNAIIPLAQGIDSNGAKNTILSKNETITGLTYTAGKNYVYCDKNGSYGVKNVAPIYTDTFSTETTGSVLKGDEYHIIQNRWQSTINTPRGDLVNPSLVNVFGDGSCKALYRFEGNTNDSSGIYNAVSANIGYAPSIFGQSASFGSTSYMNLVANPFPFTTKTISISNWVYGSVSSASLGFGRKSANVAYNGSYWFRIIGGYLSSGLSQSYENTSYNATTGRIGWNHYVTTLASNIVSIYCNGVLEKSWTLSANEQTAINAYTNLYGLNEETSQTSSGQIDQIRIFDKALSEAEVKSLYSLYSYTYDQTNSRNYLNHIVHADNDGGVLYVEELPKIEYKDIVKANEFQGKNANKVAIAFNGTTTPVTIIGDMIGFATVIRTATGVFDIYPVKDVDIRGLKFSGMTNAPQIQLSGSPTTTTGKITVITSNSAGSAVNAEYISIVGVGE